MELLLGSLTVTLVKYAGRLPTFVSVMSTGVVSNVEPTGPTTGRLIAVQLPEVSVAVQVAPGADTSTLR